MSRRFAIVLAVVVAGLAIVVGAARTEVDTGIASFLPAGDPTLAALEQKAADFGGDPIVVMLRGREPRALLTDHDQLLGLLRLEGTLAKLPDVASVYGPATALNQIAGSAQNLMARIAGSRDGHRIAAEQRAAAAGASPAAAKAAGEEAARELTLRYAPLIVRGLPVGLPTLNNPAFAGSVIYGEDGGPRERWRAVVPDAITVAVLVRPREQLDQAGTTALVDAVRNAVGQAGLATSETIVSGVPAVTSDLSRQVVREIPLISGLVALVVVLRYLVVPAGGSPRVSAAQLLAGRTGGQPEYNPVRGLPAGTPSEKLDPPIPQTNLRRRPLLVPLATGRRRWLPLAATVVGAAATFAVFGWLGRPLSFGAVALLPVLLGVGSAFPIYLSALRDRRPVLVLALASAVAFASLALSPLGFVRDLGLTLAVGILCTVGAILLMDRTTSPAPEPSFTPPGRLPRAVGAGALLVAVVAGAAGWVALPNLAVRADPQQLAGGLPAVDDALRVEHVLGSSGEVGIVLRGPDAASPAALAWSKGATATVTARFGDRLRPLIGVSDLMGFLGDSPTPAQVDAALALVPSYLSSAVLRPDRQAGLQVLGLGLGEIGNQTALLNDLAAALPPAPPGYRAEVIGLPVAAGRAYEALLADRFVVNVVGIVLAGLVLAVGLRRRWDAARAVLTAAIAAGWGFGLLALTGIGLSPLTIGLGALVTVTGCEFIVLLRAVEGAPRRMARGVLIAAATSALGYAALAASGLELLREFGLVLACAVVLSFLAALLVVTTTDRRRAPVPAPPTPTPILTKV